jgi:predicted transcriptional regulator
MPVKKETKNDNVEESPINESVDDDKIVCSLTNKQYKNTPKERNLQSVIQMLNEEYSFDLTDMERDI